MLVKIQDMTLEQTAVISDHTYLTRPENFRKKGEDGIDKRRIEFYDFLKTGLTLEPYAFCVRPEDVAKTRHFLDLNNSRIKIASVVGFPDGTGYTSTFKANEAWNALQDGAGEIDMVLNYALLKIKDYDNVKSDILAVMDEVKQRGAISKLILETCDLTADEIKISCEIADECGVDFVKTSTGYSSGGATVEALTIMRKNFPRGLKASGYVDETNYKTFLSAMSREPDGFIELNPLQYRIGESKMLKASS